MPADSTLFQLYTVHTTTKHIAHLKSKSLNHLRLMQLAETATTKKDNEYRHIGPYNTPPEHTHGCIGHGKGREGSPGAPHGRLAD